MKPDEKVPDHKDEGDNKTEESKGMSGIGIFFTIILVLGAVYFIGGAFYNYKVYNARGRDLIPHLGKLSFFFYMYLLLETKCSFLLCRILARSSLSY